MNATTNETDRARAIVRSIYDGWGRGDYTSFGNILAEKFELFVPEYLPWGGRFTKQQYVALLPKVASILDFPGMTYDSLTAEGTHVVAFIVIGVRGTDTSIMISEHWDLVDGKATKLRVAYYDPKVLLEQLGEPAVA